MSTCIRYEEVAWICLCSVQRAVAGSRGSVAKFSDFKKARDSVRNGFYVKYYHRTGFYLNSFTRMKIPICIIGFIRTFVLRANPASGTPFVRLFNRKMIMS